MREHHGMTGTRIWKAWVKMRERCTNPNAHDFPYYGGRGITVCERWQSFTRFYEDMGDPPPGMQLERVDNNANYEPSNVRWASRTEQARNRRTNRRLTHAGETLTVAEWAERLGVPATRLHARLGLGWDASRVLSEPSGAHLVTYNGASLSVKAWAARVGVPVPTLKDRLQRGWSLERALSTPRRHGRPA